jgi:ketosteroid isomerase-like protein
MKIRLLLALVGSVIGFTLPAFAQQKDRVNPQIVEQLNTLRDKSNEAFENGDAAALAVLYTDDAVEVTNEGPIYGREAIEKHYTDLFKEQHFSNRISKRDQYSPHILGKAGDEEWSTGEWSQTVHGLNWGPEEVKGYWSTICVREGDAWKFRMLTWNMIPASTPTGKTAPSASGQ